MHIAKNILIVGADGMIGSTLREKFGNSFIISSTGFYNENSRCTYIGDLSKIKFAELVANACISPDVLIFLVGLAHKKGKGKDIFEFKTINYQTLINLLVALKKANKTPGKIIFASTISVYGERKSENIYTESSQTIPFSPYARTKLLAEEFLLEKYPEKSWILRLAPVYSNNFTLNIKRRTQMGGFGYKIGNGKVQLSLCNLLNIHAAIEGIVNNKIPAGTYNLSDKIEYSYNDLLMSLRAKTVLRIPKLIFSVMYYAGNMINNISIKENTVKLISDNIYPSKKIRTYIDLPATLSAANFND